MTEIFNSLGVNRDLLILILAVISVALVVMLVLILIRTKNMYQRYDFFMRGKDAETLEDTVMETYSKMHALQDIQMEHRDRIKLLQTSVNAAFNKIGIVKYNAFDGMGAQSSFVLAVLDQKNNGFLLNAMHSRTSCYLYIKEVKNGEADSALSSEEQAAFDKAKNS